MLAIEAVAELERRDEAVMRHWRLRLERAQYEAGLAERRYEEVDPANRLVAATLEERWNDALKTLEEVRRQMEEFQQTHGCVVTPEQRARVLALAQDFPRLWNAPSTSPKDRKRMLRLLLKDITVERDASPRRAVLRVRWQSGACEQIVVALPPDRVRTPPQVIERVRELATNTRDHQIAAILNREKRTSARGKLFSVSAVRAIRRAHGIAASYTGATTELTVPEAARRFGVLPEVVDRWIEAGLVEARTVPIANGTTRRWVTILPEQESRLRQEAAGSVPGNAHGEGGAV
ncbi:MAG: hypothetical protein ACREQ9_17340 [Candidatus Binatia bacterium]